MPLLRLIAKHRHRNRIRPREPLALVEREHDCNGRLAALCEALAQLVERAELEAQLLRTRALALADARLVPALRRREDPIELALRIGEGADGLGTTQQPRTKSPECDASRPGCFHGVA
jgi:hypothetical protein